jgi:hypothetical protein
MCEPVTIGLLSAGLGAAQAVGSYADQRQEANNQNQMYAKNVANAQAAFSSEQNTLQQKEVQTQEAYAQKSFEMAQEAQRVHATAENNSAGQAGLSVESLLMDIDRQEADRQAANSQNLVWEAMDSIAERNASGATYVNRVNNVPKGQAPSAARLGLGIVGAGVQGFGTFHNLTNEQSRINASR